MVMHRSYTAIQFGLAAYSVHLLVYRVASFWYRNFRLPRSWSVICVGILFFIFTYRFKPKDLP